MRFKFYSPQMITFEEATAKANAHLSDMDVPYELVIVPEATVTFMYGWVFSYQNAKYLKTRNIFDKLGGNSPVIVDKYDGSLHATGTGRPKEWYIKQYIKQRAYVLPMPTWCEKIWRWFY